MVHIYIYFESNNHGFTFFPVFSLEAILWVNTGEKFTMKCSTTLKDQEGMYLYVGLDRDREVLYYYQRDSKLTPRKRYWD